jgi:hypothetical protein
MKPIVARSVLGVTGTFLAGVVFSVCLHGQEVPPKAVIVTPTSPAQKDVQSIGEAAIDRLAVSMVNEVRSALGGGEPEDAVDICHLKALPTIPGGIISGMPRIAAVKFTSLKIRASENMPDAADKAALDYIDHALNRGNAAPTVVVQRIDTPDSPVEWRVYKPIGITSNCLTCHGDPADQSPRLRGKLKAMYPEDQAIGFKSHDWRGVIRVTVSDGPAN